jgi:hypothetical protein
MQRAQHVLLARLPKRKVPQRQPAGACSMDACPVRQHSPAWFEPAVTCRQQGVQHALKQQGVAHPLAHKYVHLQHQHQC